MTALRRATCLICLLDLAGFLVMAGLLLFGQDGDAATGGLDVAAAVVLALLFALTALPAGLLARAGRAPRLALGLALAFPGAFALLLAAVALTLP